MNIFYLDIDPEKAANYSCDKHTVKMILETAQMLCTVRSVLNCPDLTGYTLKPTHVNHPCNKWARESRANYSWLYNYLQSLCSEYTRRYGKVHKIQESGLMEQLSVVPEVLPNLRLTSPPQCMPDSYKVEVNSVEAYRRYYIYDKSRFAKWKLGNIPEWYKLEDLSNS